MPSEPAIVSPTAAASAVERAAGVQLRRAPAATPGLPNVPNVPNLLAAYTSSGSEPSLLLLVFDSDVATQQAVGWPPANSVPGVSVVRRRNVLVIDRGPDVDRRRARIEAALDG